MSELSMFNGANLEFFVAGNRISSSHERPAHHPNCVPTYDTLFYTANPQESPIALQGTRNCKGLFLFQQGRTDGIGAIHLYPTQTSLDHFKNSLGEKPALNPAECTTVVLSSTKEFYNAEEENLGFQRFVDELNDAFPGITLTQKLMIIDPIVEHCTIEAGTKGLSLFNWDVWKNEQGETGFLQDGKIVPIEPILEALRLKIETVNKQLLAIKHKLPVE